MLQVDTLYCFFSTPPPSGVLRHVIRLAEALNAPVCVLRREGDPERSLARLSRARRRVQTAHPVGLEEQVVSDDPTEAAQRIRAHAREHPGAALLLTVPGPSPDTTPSGAAPLLGGTFAQALACRSGLPVYVFGETPSLGDTRRLLVFTSLSEAAPDVLEQAALLASVSGASIALLHVIDRSPYVALTPVDRLSLEGPTLAEWQARRRLRAVVRASQVLDVPIQTHLRFGEPADEIVALARQDDVGAVVLPIRNCDADPEQPFGSVAGRVLRRVDAPFLLVPSSEEVLDTS